MPKENVHNVSGSFGSAISAPDVVDEPFLMLATGNYLTDINRNSLSPNSNVASLSRGQNLWLLAGHGFKTASVLVKKPEKRHRNNA